MNEIKKRAEARAKKIASKRQFAIDQQNATQCEMFADAGEKPEKILEDVLNDRAEERAEEERLKAIFSQDVTRENVFDWRHDLFGTRREESPFDQGTYDESDIPF